QVPFEPGTGRLMQGNQPALPELGGADHQPVRRDIVVSETDRLGDAKSGAGQKCKEGAVSLSAQGAVSRLCGHLNDPVNLLVGEKVRSRARPTFSAKKLESYLMMCVLSMEIQREASNVS